MTTIYLYFLSIGLSILSIIFFKFYTIYTFCVFLFKDNYETYFSLGESIIYLILSYLALIVIQLKMSRQ